MLKAAADKLADLIQKTADAIPLTIGPVSKTESEFETILGYQERGEPAEKKQMLEVDKTPSGRTRIRVVYPDGDYGVNVSKADALLRLAAASNRSSIYVTHEG